ncbi:MAG: SIS domain-containing protein [Betaproteobacteria bacterium]
MLDHIKTSLQQAQSVLAQLLENEKALASIEAAARLLLEAFAQSGRAFSCGNGGSMCDAMHFAEELTGRFRKDRPGIAAMAISDPGHLTCVANDFGYDQVFARFLEAHGRAGDVLLAISTSGRSASILNAAKTAKARGIRVIGLVGRQDSELAALSDVCICTPGGAFADRVQELHIKVIHILIELIERQLHPQNYP